MTSLFLSLSLGICFVSTSCSIDARFSAALSRDISFQSHPCLLTLLKFQLPESDLGADIWDSSEASKSDGVECSKGQSRASSLKKISPGRVDAEQTPSCSRTMCARECRKTTETSVPICSKPQQIRPWSETVLKLSHGRPSPFLFWGTYEARLHCKRRVGYGWLICYLSKTHFVRDFPKNAWSCEDKAFRARCHPKIKIYQDLRAVTLHSLFRFNDMISVKQKFHKLPLPMKWIHQREHEPIHMGQKTRNLADLAQQKRKIVNLII